MNEENGTNRSYPFYRSWAESIFILETEADKHSPALQLFRAITEYSLGGKKPDFTGLQPAAKYRVQCFWKKISAEIDQSKIN